MLKFGYVTNYDDCGRVIVQIQDEDEVTTDYLPIVKTFVSKDSSGGTIDTGTLVAVVLDDANPSSGVCLGVVDVLPRENVNKSYHKYADGTLLQYDRVTHVLSADVKGSIVATAKKTSLNSPLFVADNIVSDKDVSDKIGTMQAIRDAFNNHTHSNGNNGANTGVPTKKI